MTEYEYKMLKGNWDGEYGAAYNAVAEFCLEFGWMDHFGFVTAKGYKAIAKYESEKL